MTPLTVMPESTVVEVAPHEEIAEPVRLRTRLGNIVGVAVPFLGLVGAILLLCGWGFFGWVDFGLLVGMTVLTILGITVGFHRLFTHRSFETNRVVQCILAILGSMAVQGTLKQWVSLHRRHHQFSDGDGDPHSPHHYGRGLFGFLGGFWHSHVGWLFLADPPGLDRYGKDIEESRLLRAMSSLFPVWWILGLVIPAVLGGLLTGSWLGALFGFMWGGLVRVFLVHHVTWSINSVCHLWGQRPYACHDQSRNNIVFGVLGFGEGWHNNHHAFPTSARHGLQWWQLDVSYWVIRGLALVRLAWNVRVPSRHALAQQDAH